MGLPGIQVNGDGAANSLLGTRRDDILAGAGGNDSLGAGMGDDTLYGGTGDDIVYVDLGNDFHFGGAGVDTLRFTVLDYSSEGAIDFNTFGVTFDLAIVGLQDLGYLGRDYFYGFENVTGSSGNDSLFGDAGVNTLDGFVGNDFVNGRGGNDILIGDGGADVLIGGAGADSIDCYFLALGNDFARDTVRYSAVSESGTGGATRDTILSFTRGAAATADRIDLSAIDANPTLAGNQAFLFIGTTAFRANRVGEVRIIDLGADVLVSIDADSDNTHEMTIMVNNVATLTAGDFIL